MRHYVLPVFTFLVALAVITWGAYWKVKVEPDTLCAAHLMYCLRDSDADEFIRQVERESGGKGPPAGVLWCRCAWRPDQ